MAVNRVDFAGRTLIDLTGDTVDAQALLAGRTAHGADGGEVVGALPAACIIGDMLVAHPSVAQADSGTIWFSGTYDKETKTIWIGV